MPAFGMHVCVCAYVCVCVCQTLSSVEQLVDIEPSPVSAMRMTLAQVVLTTARINLFFNLKLLINLD